MSGIYSFIPAEETIKCKSNVNYRNLKDHINNNKFLRKKGDTTANLIDVEFKRLYKITSSDSEIMFNNMDQCRKNNLHMHLSERQYNKEYDKSGIMIDIDRYQYLNRSDFNPTVYQSIANKLSDLIHDHLVFTPHYKAHVYNYNIFFIRKPNVKLDETRTKNLGRDVYKDGIHILIPELWVSHGYKKFLLETIKNKNIISSAFYEVDNDPIEEMVDLASANNPVHFMGNCKPKSTPYYLDFQIQVKTTDRGNVTATFVNIDDINNYNLCYELSLSFYFSELGGKPTKLIKNKFEYNLHIADKIKEDIIEQPTDDNIESEVTKICDESAEAKYLVQLLDILTPDYYTDYLKWLYVIQAIANTNKKWLNIAHKFSMKCVDKYDKLTTESTFASFANKSRSQGYTLKSIVYWASKCDADKVKEIRGECNFNILNDAIYQFDGRIEHTILARILKIMYGYKFCSDHKKGTSKQLSYEWYEFVEEHDNMCEGEIYKWRKEVEPELLYNSISEDMPKLYKIVSNNLAARLDKDNQDPSLVKYLTSIQKELRLYKSRVNNAPYKGQVIKEAKLIFRQRGFADQLDNYVDVLGVGNGVLKLTRRNELGEYDPPELITGRHDYKISEYTKTKYVPYDNNNPHIHTLLRAFKDIFIEDDVFEFMMLHAATGLDKKESNCLLTLIVGGGQNGKSFFSKIIQETLGNTYCVAGKAALLTSPIERSESANSAQMQLSGKRYVYFDEFGKVETLNPIRIKTIANPSYQSGRDLNEKQLNFKNTVNPIAFSNYPFNIDTTDHGTWRRIYYYKAKMKFCSNPDPNNKYEKLENLHMIHDYCNNPDYLEAMLSILVHYYDVFMRKYGGNLKNIPVPTIKYETEEFRNSQDKMNRFLTTTLVYSPDSPHIELNSLVNKYQEWYKSKYSRHCPDNADSIAATMENSRISEYLTRKNDICHILTKHRIISSQDEDLQDGERLLIMHRPN